MSLVWAVLLLTVVTVGWALNLLSLPGNWLIAGAAVGYALLVSGEERVGLGWGVVAALVALAVVGEILELAAGAAGVTKAGGSRRSALLAIGGSMAGALTGALVGIPIPLVGPLVGILLFAALGALAGAALGERWKGRDAEQSWRVGHAAFWSRLLGTFGKLLVGGVMVVIVAAAIVLR